MDAKGDLLVITTDGYGKRTSLTQFRPQNRGGIGLIAIKFKTPNSRLTTLLVVKDYQEIMISSANGIVTRQICENISKQSRTATGVNIQNLDDNDYIAGVTRLIKPKAPSIADAEGTNQNVPAIQQPKQIIEEPPKEQKIELGSEEPEEG